MTCLQGLVNALARGDPLGAVRSSLTISPSVRASYKPSLDSQIYLMSTNPPPIESNQGSAAF